MKTAIKAALGASAVLRLKAWRDVLAWRLSALREPTRKQGRHIWICGWYGTETVGDKLILLGLLRQIWARSPGSPVTVVSSNPRYTQASLIELAGLIDEGAQGLELRNRLLRQTSAAGEGRLAGISAADVLVFGGGPIMDDPAILKWVEWATLARARGAARAVLGCGLGPLRKPAPLRWAGKLLALADVIVLRESGPGALAKSLPADAASSLDPAFLTWPVVKRFRRDGRAGLAVNLRFVPKEYGGPETAGLDGQADWLAGRVEALAAVMASNAPLAVFSTHELDRVGDLAVTSAVLERLCGSHPGLAAAELVAPSIDRVFSCLGRAQRAIAMRYHGVIMALMMGCDVYGLDYDIGGGKLSKLYHDFGLDIPPASIFGSGPLPADSSSWINAGADFDGRIEAAERIYQEALARLDLTA